MRLWISHHHRHEIFCGVGRIYICFFAFFDDISTFIIFVCCSIATREDRFEEFSSTVILVACDASLQCFRIFDYCHFCRSSHFVVFVYDLVASSVGGSRFRDSISEIFSLISKNIGRFVYVASTSLSVYLGDDSIVWIVGICHVYLPFGICERYHIVCEKWISW